ncbi:MAG: hypothetical protein QXR53_01860 [Candidatus Norongarragalinales archaeon]
MELDLPFGPWKEIASADWNGVPTGVYANSEKLLLMVAFSKEPPSEGKGKKQGEESALPELPSGKQGVLVLLKKPLFLEGPGGSVEKFLQNQTRDLSLVSKVLDKRHYTYVLLEAQPFFVEFRKEELVKAVKAQREEVEALAKITFDVARSYGCRARELDKTEEGVSENLLGDPVSLFAFSGFKGRQSSSQLQEKKSVLGFGADGQQVEISPAEMQVSLVSGQGKQPRLKAMQVCIENLLISGVPCLVVGESDFFQCLAFPNKNSVELEKAGLPKASGFPLKSYSLGKGFYIDLRFVQAKSFSKLFFPSELQGLVEGAWGEGTLSGLREKLEQQQQKYAFAKAIRILSAAEKAFPGFFASNSAEELKNPWSATGKVALLNAEAGELHALAVESVLNSLGEPKEGKTLAVVLESDAAKLPAETIGILSSVQSKLFLVLNTESDAGETALESIAPTLRIELLGATSASGEVVAYFSGEKKRLVLRPAFSS